MGRGKRSDVCDVHEEPMINPGWFLEKSVPGFHVLPFRCFPPVGVGQFGETDHMSRAANSWGGLKRPLDPAVFVHVETHAPCHRHVQAGANEPDHLIVSRLDAFGDQ